MARNIVIIMTDQQRADFCRREGYPLDVCPFQDELARTGGWFNSAYTSSPMCVPARVSLLTGRYPSAHHVRINENFVDAYYEKDAFDVFREAGFKTAMVGKNHSHATSQKTDFWYEVSHNRAVTENRTEEEEAFDNYITEMCHGVAKEPTPFPLECQLAYRTVTQANQWVRSLDNEDHFFMWLSFDGPHGPYQAPEPYYSMFPLDSLPPLRAGKKALQTKGFKYEWCRHIAEVVYPGYDDEIARMRPIYHGTIRMIDDQIQRFVRCLEETGRREETLIVFCSDHGDFAGEYGLLRKGPEIPETTVRMPLLFNGPAVVSNTAPHRAFASIVDILPTVCEAAEVDTPFGVQGRSLWPLLTGKDATEAEFDTAYAEQGMGGRHYSWEDNPQVEKCQLRTTFNELNQYTMSGSMRMVRKGSFKLLMDMEGRGQLYNLAQDPAELENLYDQKACSDIQNELQHEMIKWCLKTQDPMPCPRHGMKLKP